ncbi:glycerophosphodiester phosphodiesterase family protein [Bradyrhizobium sp. LHD-71]|uniref:glycerophosphodiester phosphodiesterase family protein n=1 Tax=Bradyrhizobium sp. LHD-71 TaxID=3072141 RepID=UPI00280D35BF|nr:glycerophosphodiester phosphodiesterase family protein [Bradyrhizobium sp. LHD-71]MDQ8731418.1 glycerophosphodiester phosphodiesterase family protein [Bradyrhizobium sp. LHD-71]
MPDITLLAHRGSNPYPDHSMDAYKAAINWGADFIEPDLFLTKDGVLVCSHDNHGFENKTYAQALAENPNLVTFDQVIELVKEMSIETGRNIGITLETKSANYATSEAVIQKLVEHDFTDPSRVYINSFGSANLISLHEEIMPKYGVDIPLMQLGSGMNNLEQVATYADGIAPSIGSYTKEQVDRAHALGLEVHTWTSAGTSTSQLQNLINMGVDAVYVDNMDAARTNVEALNGVKVIYGADDQDDELSGTDGNDLVYAMKGDDAVEAGAGDDLVYGDGGDDTVDGGDGNDTLIGGAGDDELQGGAGHDALIGGVGDDLIDGGEGIDTVDYSADSAGIVVDLATGEANGDDIGADELIGVENVIGGSGDDSLTGDDAANRLDGGAGDDALDGGAGDDLILAGLGNDTIDGGAGFDTLDLSAATGPVSVDFGAGRVSGQGIGTDSFTNIEKLLFGAGDDVVSGGNGDDAFDGGAGNDTLKGGAGDDTLWGGEGNDALDGGSGDDAVYGGLGNDTIKAGSGDDQIDAGQGNDVLDAGSGDDVVLAGAGDDVVDGGSGDDRIEGGEGNDLLSGGSGHDVFVFAADFGKDTVGDFKTTGSSADVLEFAIDVFANFDAAIGAAHQEGADIVFAVDADTSLTLKNVQLASLQADDFHFV